MPEDQGKQLEAMERMMDLLKVESAERPLIRTGARLFFAAGWPSNYFDLGMALAAGKGLQPQPYESFVSKRKYQERMHEAGFYVPDSAGISKAKL